MSRILIISDRGGRDGAEQVNHALALGLHAAGFEVQVAQPWADHDLIDTRTAQGIAHCWLPAEDLYDPRRPAPSMTDPSAAFACFMACQPDLVLFADSFPFANLAAKRTAAMLGIPYLVLVHCVTLAWAAQYREYLPALAAGYAGAASVIAVSADNLALLRAHFELSPRRGLVIHNGRPPAFFAPRDARARARERAALGIPDAVVVALSIGRLELVKGWTDLLAALPLLRRCPNWPRLHLVWVGNGTLAARLDRMALPLGQGQVHLLPPRGDVPALLDAADLLVHPARFEGMPLVVLEAMARGVPIIATRVSGIPEALGDAGCLLDPPAVVGAGPFAGLLAKAICDLAGDPLERARIGAAAQARAAAAFTEARMVADWVILVRDTLAATGSVGPI
jgi:glycosyltransferase involved in cell wall biosynthesis